MPPFSSFAKPVERFSRTANKRKNNSGNERFGKRSDRNFRDWKKKKGGTDARPDDILRRQRSLPPSLRVHTSASGSAIIGRSETAVDFIVIIRFSNILLEMEIFVVSSSVTIRRWKYATAFDINSEGKSGIRGELLVVRGALIYIYIYTCMYIRKADGIGAKKKKKGKREKEKMGAYLFNYQRYRINSLIECQMARIVPGWRALCPAWPPLRVGVSLPFPRGRRILVAHTRVNRATTNN